MNCGKILTRLAILLAGFGVLTPAPTRAESDVIQPDAAIQSKLSEIAKANNSKTQIDFYRGIASLRSVAINTPKELIRQLVWYDVHTATNGEMTTIAVLNFLPELRNNMVAALAPLMGKTQDTKSEHEIKELLYVAERDNGIDQFNFRDYEEYIRGKVDGNLPFDEPFVAYLFRRASGRTLQAFALATFDDNRRKPFLWARHVIDDLLWRRQFGFAGNKQPDELATEQLEKMAGSKEWWARMYAAEIIREHPELGNDKLLEQLKNDKNELVRTALESEKELLETTEARGHPLDQGSAVPSRSGSGGGLEEPKGLKDPDPTVRLQSWRTLVGTAPEFKSRIDQILPQLPQGLRDSDAAVRKYATAIAMGIGLEALGEHKFLLSRNPDVAVELFNLLDDGDPKIREDAAHAIARGVEPTKDNEDLLLSKYWKESNPDRRAELIQLLVQTSGKKWASSWDREPTQPVIQIVVKAIDDQNKPVRDAAVDAIRRIKSPPVEVLPKLIDRLDTSASAEHIEAIKKYGAAACQYLPRLEVLRKQADDLTGAAGRSLRMNLDIALQYLRAVCEKAASGETK